MNSVNQMVTDLKERMDDDSTDTLDSKTKKKSPSKKTAGVSSKFIVAMLLLAAGLLSYLNYETEIGQKLSQETQSLIPFFSENVSVIATLPDSESLDAGKIDRKYWNNNSERSHAIGGIEGQVEFKQTSTMLEKPVEENEKLIESPASIAEPAKFSKAPVVAEAAKTEKKTTVKQQIVAKLEQTAKPSVSRSSASQSSKSKPPVMKTTASKTTASKTTIPKATVPKAVKAKADNFNKTFIPLTNAEIAEATYQDGVNLLDDGEIVSAKSMLVKALKEYPAHTKAREVLVGIYSNEQDWPKVESLLVSAIQEDKRNVSFVMWLSQVYMQQEKNQQALSLLKESVVYAKGNGEYFAMVAALQQQAGEYDLALQAYQKALKTDNTVSRWWFGMAVVLEYQSNWADAQISYTQALNTGKLPTDLLAYAEQRLEYVELQFSNNP